MWERRYKSAFIRVSTSLYGLQDTSPHLFVPCSISNAVDISSISKPHFTDEKTKAQSPPTGDLPDDPEPGREVLTMELIILKLSEVPA